ncbi:hypothetical protein BH10PSE4_BH10PSE4_05390 [soil metagenome]
MGQRRKLRQAVFGGSHYQPISACLAGRKQPWRGIKIVVKLSLTNAPKLAL